MLRLGTIIPSDAFRFELFSLSPPPTLLDRYCRWFDTPFALCLRSTAMPRQAWIRNLGSRGSRPRIFRTSTLVISSQPNSTLVWYIPFETNLVSGRSPRSHKLDPGSTFPISAQNTPKPRSEGGGWVTPPCAGSVTVCYQGSSHMTLTVLNLFCQWLVWHCEG